MLAPSQCSSVLSLTVGAAYSATFDYWDGRAYTEPATSVNWKSLPISAYFANSNAVSCPILGCALFANDCTADYSGKDPTNGTPLARARQDAAGAWFLDLQSTVMAGYGENVCFACGTSD